MSALRTFLKKQAWNLGYAIKAQSKPRDVAAFIDEFRSNMVSVAMVRAGDDVGDGAYLVPSDFAGVDCCFSPGVDVKSDFELWLGETHGIRSYLADASVQGMPVPKPYFDFEPLFLGVETKAPFSTLEAWMRSKIDLQDQPDMILQMDIEGAEFPVLVETSRDVLKLFRTIVLEVHFMERIFDADALPFISDVFKKLYADFAIAHVHPNNASEIIQSGANKVPSIFEITFIRRDRINAIRQSSPIQLPHALDVPNVPHRPDILMPEAWWKGAS